MPSTKSPRNRLEGLNSPGSSKGSRGGGNLSSYRKRPFRMNYAGAPKNKTELLNSLKNKSYTPRIQFEEMSNFS